MSEIFSNMSEIFRNMSEIFRIFSFLSADDGEEGWLWSNEPSKIWEMCRHGQPDLLKRSQCVTQPQSEVSSRSHICKYVFVCCLLLFDKLFKIDLHLFLCEAYIDPYLAWLAEGEWWVREGATFNLLHWLRIFSSFPWDCDLLSGIGKFFSVFL